MTEHPAAPATEADHLRWLVRNSERVYPEVVESALAEARAAARKEVRTEVLLEAAHYNYFQSKAAHWKLRNLLDSLSTDTREEPT